MSCTHYTLLCTNYSKYIAEIGLQLNGVHATHKHIIYTTKKIIHAITERKHALNKHAGTNNCMYVTFGKEHYMNKIILEKETSIFYTQKTCKS